VENCLFRNTGKSAVQFNSTDALEVINCTVRAEAMGVRCSLLV